MLTSQFVSMSHISIFVKQIKEDLFRRETNYLPIGFALKSDATHFFLSSSMVSCLYPETTSSS